MTLWTRKPPKVALRLEKARERMEALKEQREFIEYRRGCLRGRIKRYEELMSIETGLLNENGKEMTELSKEIATLKALEVKVTDHAVVRYLQRVKGVDIDEIVDELLINDDHLEKLCKIRDDDIVQMNGGSYKVALRGGILKTVMTPEGEE